jgi:hypothetical protein
MAIDIVLSHQLITFFYKQVFLFQYFFYKNRTTDFGGKIWQKREFMQRMDVLVLI